MFKGNKSEKKSENYLLKLCEEPLLCFDSLLTSYSEKNVFYDEQNRQFFSIRSGGIIDISVRTLTALALKESEKSDGRRPYSAEETIPSLKIRLPDGVAISSVKFSPGNRVLAIQRISLDSSIQIINIEGKIDEFGQVPSGDILQFQSSQIINLYSTQSLPSSSNSNQMSRLAKEEPTSLGIGNQSTRKRTAGKIEEFFWLSDRDIVLVMNDRLEHFVLLFDRSTATNQQNSQNNVQNKKFFRLISSWTFHSIRWVKWSLQHSTLLLCLSNDKRSATDQINSVGDMFLPDYAVAQPNSKLITSEMISGNSSNRTYSATSHCPEKEDRLTELMYSKENLLCSDVYLQPILFLNGLLQRLPVLPISKRLLRDISLHFSSDTQGVTYPKGTRNDKSEKKLAEDEVDELTETNRPENLNVLFSTSNFRVDDSDVSILTLYDRVYLSLLCRYEKKDQTELPFVICDTFLFELSSLFQPPVVRYICRLPSSALLRRPLRTKDFSLTVHSIDNLLVLHHYSTATSHLFDIGQQQTNDKQSPNYLSGIFERRKLMKKSTKDRPLTSSPLNSSSSSSTSFQRFSAMSPDKLNSLNINDVSKPKETDQLSCSGRLLDDEKNRNFFSQLTNESLKRIATCYPLFSPASIRPTANSSPNLPANEIVLYSKGWRSFAPNIIIDVAIGAIWTLHLNFDQFHSLSSSIDLQRQIIVFQKSSSDERLPKKQRLNRKKRIEQLRNVAGRQSEEDDLSDKNRFLGNSSPRDREKQLEIRELNFNYLVLFHLIDFFTRRPDRSSSLELLLRKFFEKNSLDHLPALKYFADVFDIQSRALRAKRTFEEKYGSSRASDIDSEESSVKDRELLIYRLHRERNVESLPSSIERLGLYNNFNHFQSPSSASVTSSQTTTTKTNVKRQNRKVRQFDWRVDSLTKDVDRFVPYSPMEESVLFNIFHEIFEDWISNDIRSNYLYSILVEYIRSFSEQNISISYFVFEMLIQHLVRTSSFYQFHQNLQYQIFTDSKPLACILLSLEKIYSPAPYLSLDMFKRLNYSYSRSHHRNEEFHDMIEILINKSQVQDALQLSRPLFTTKYISQKIDGRKFIQSIIDQSPFDLHLFLNTFLFIFYRLDNVKKIIERGKQLTDDHQSTSSDINQNFINSNELNYRYIDYANYFHKFVHHFPSFDINKILER